MSHVEVPMASVLRDLVDRDVILRVGGGEVAGTVRRVEGRLVWLDTTLQQQRPSPLAQGQMVMVQTPAELVVDAGSVVAVISPKQANGTPADALLLDAKKG